MATVSDDFNRADEAPLGAPWAASVGAIDLVSQEVTSGSGQSSDCCMFWDDDFDADQFSEVVYTGGDQGVGPAVRVSAGETFYTTWSSGGNMFIAKHVSGASQTIGASYEPVGEWEIDDVLRMEVSGDEISMYRNDVLLATRTDTDISSGAPGMYMWGTFDTTFDAFAGGDIAIAVGQPSETDLAQPITALKTYSIGQATETDQALPVTVLKTHTLGLAVETDTALTLVTGEPTPPIVLPPYRESAVPDYRERSVPAYQESAT